MGDFQSALDDWFGHAIAMKSRYGGSDPISEFRDAGNLDDVYAAARLKYPATVDDEVNRLTAERVNSRAPGPGGAAYSPEQWREYFGNVVPQQRAAQAEQQQFDDTRTPLNRLLSADAFAVSAPIRMLTGGQYGASNLLEMLPAYRGMAPAVARGEQDFARANEGALETIAQAGESAMALPGTQELGAIEGGIGGTLRVMRNTKAVNALDRLLPAADDASRTMSMSGVTPKPNFLRGQNASFDINQAMEKFQFLRDKAFKAQTEKERDGLVRAALEQIEIARRMRRNYQPGENLLYYLDEYSRNETGIPTIHGPGYDDMNPSPNWRATPKAENGMLAARNR